MPNGGGGWTEKKLHNFGLYETDGTTPQAGLIFDAAGNLYGTTSQGGDYYGGTVFELTPNGSGGWTEKKLHNFSGEFDYTDGYQPNAGLIFDAAGNLYGTTSQGGDHGAGTVFELTSNGSGGWTEKKLHNFGNGSDGTHPYAGLIFDAAGNLYGTASGGGFNNCQNNGNDGCGTMFKLVPNDRGGWTEQEVWNFGNHTDGINPYAGLIFDSAGNLFGTTQGDSCFNNYGTVFEWTP
jgi:uncharacterized repeat protein (TIGR03803 family)